MKLGVVGGGVVGRATARCFMEHAEVCVYDVVKERATHSLSQVLDCDLIFVCLPTPQKEGLLESDLLPIELFFSGLKPGRRRENNFILRSTVPIGTTRGLKEKYNLPNLVHSPEFLTARCSITDAQIPSRNIVGGGKCMKCGGCADLLTTLYLKRFPGVPVFQMESCESEAVKLFLNGFFATKVAYFNEVRSLADKLSLNWEKILEGMLSDGRITHSHTQVPGPDGKFGFGGNCLPKDLANLIQCMDVVGVEPHVTRAVLRRNVKDRER